MPPRYRAKPAPAGGHGSAASDTNLKIPPPNAGVSVPIGGRCPVQDHSQTVSGGVPEPLVQPDLVQPDLVQPDLVQPESCTTRILCNQDPYHASR